MDITMESEDLKTAWQSLDRQLQQHNRINLALLRDTRIDKARRGLRPLLVGQTLQGVLGVGLILLGLACWSRNVDVPGLFASGIALHAFGVLTVAMAALTIGLAAAIDYSAPVLVIQKQMARLLRFYTVNSNLCGAPWWVAWVLVVIAFAGLGGVDAAAPTPTWILVSLVLGVVGTLATWGWTLLRGARTRDASAPCADGGDGIRCSQRLLDEISSFERE